MLLYVDQLRADAMRCAGNLAIETPNLDRLAAQGVRFTNAVTTTPVCIAARYALLTGRRSGHNGRYGNNNVDPEPCLDTIPAMLGHADYLNYSVGKMHFLPKRRHYGFHFRRVMGEIPDWRQDDDYLLFLKERGYGHKREVHGVRNLLYVQPQTSPLPEELHGSTWVGDEIIDFLRLNHNRKFFLWAGWIGPHPPYNAPEPFASMYRLEDMPAPIAPDFDPDDLPLVMQMQRYYANYENASPERLLRCVALYYAVTSLIDKQVGRILDTLDELGIADDTLLVFTGDHGELLGDYGCVQKSNPRDQAVRVPMIARWPGRLPQGATCDDLVTCIDLLPTFLEAAEHDHPVLQELPGTSLLEADGGGHERPRREFVTDYGLGKGRWLSLRRPPLKYNYYCDNGLEELFDLESDPHELRNLLHDGDAQARRTADEMRCDLVAWERENGFPETSLEGDDFRNYGQQEPVLRRNNQFPIWVNNLPEDEKRQLEPPGKSVEEAIAREDTFSLDELDLEWFKEHGGSLEGSEYEGLLDNV